MFKQEVSNKINKISKILLNSDKEQVSLLSGKGGEALFDIIYSLNFESEKHNEKMFRLFNDIFEKVNKGFLFPSFARGIAGIGWLVEFLEQKDFIETNTNEIIGELDKYLYSLMIAEAKKGNFDYLHGAGGIALYFLKRVKKMPVIKIYLSEYIEILDKISIKEDNDKYKWFSIVKINENNQKKVYNLSISHGIASIISILSKTYLFGINISKSKELLKGAINFLLSCEQDIGQYNSYFPNIVETEYKKNGNSRLAWCYGDLGISVALWNASQVLKNKVWEKKAIEILLHSAKRKDLKKNGVIDAGLCHGTSGIAHVFNRMYFNTSIEKFKEASIYWFEQSIKMAKFNDGLAGYKTWRTSKYGGWQNDYGFLTGISGIGLSLMSAISDNEPIWDECLLLS